MGEVREAEFWKRNAFALFRRLVGPAAAAQAVQLQRAEIDVGSLMEAGFDNEADDKVLVRFEVRGGS